MYPEQFLSLELSGARKQLCLDDVVDVHSYIHRSSVVNDGDAEQNTTWCRPEATRTDRDRPGDRLPGSLVSLLMQTWCVTNFCRQ